MRDSNMNKNRKALSLALGGMMVPLGLANVLEHAAGQETARPQSSVGRIGDEPDSAVESTDNQPATLDNDTRPEAFRKNTGTASDFSGTPDLLTAQQGDFYTASHMQSQSAANDQIPSAPVSYSNGSIYDSVVGSSSATPSTSGCVTNACGTKLAKLGWAEVDALLWWGPNSTTPPLVVSGPVGSLTPTNVLAGGDQAPLGGGLLPGIRANLGIWLDDCETTGVGGRFTTLLTGDTTQSFVSNGPNPTSLGLPFFNVSSGAPDVFLVALDAGANGADTGSVTVNNQTSFLQAEAYGRFLLARAQTARADLLGGYTFARLDDSLGILSRTVDGISGGAPDGTVETFNDQFSTQNTFHGGHIGFTSDITRGCWTFSTLSKVSIGNMRQVGTVAGSGNNLQNNQGFYARNIGTQTRDVFTFLPEAGAKLRYQVTEKMMFNVGYSFLFFPDVAMSSGLIDTNIDITPIAAPTAPQPRFANDSFYLHGIDLGLSFSF
jgi:hypothetical protein